MKLFDLHESRRRFKLSFKQARDSAERARIIHVPYETMNEILADVHNAELFDQLRKRSKHLDLHALHDKQVGGKKTVVDFSKSPLFKEIREAMFKELNVNRDLITKEDWQVGGVHNPGSPPKFKPEISIDCFIEVNFYRTFGVDVRLQEL